MGGGWTMVSQVVLLWDMGGGGGEGSWERKIALYLSETVVTTYLLPLFLIFSISPQPVLASKFQFSRKKRWILSFFFVVVGTSFSLWCFLGRDRVM